MFDAVYNECVWLHFKWYEYSQLFGTKPERIEILNAAASFFFRIVQDVFWDDTLLHLARLTDPERTGPHHNLTIRALPSLVGADLRTQLTADVAGAVTATEFARDWRNRRLAHSDLELAVREGATPLASASRRQVRDALEAIDHVLNRVHRRYLGGSVMFSEIATYAGSVSLLQRLRDGVEFDEELRRRLLDGTLDPKELAQRRNI